LGRIVARLAKTPIIITGIRIENFGYNGFHSFLERSTSGWVDLYISVSEQSRKLLLKQHWIPEEKVVVIHNGIDLNWAKLYTSQNVDSREKRIFPNGVTGGKRTTFFPARGVKTPIERGLGKIQIGMIAAFNHFKTQDSIVLAAPKILETFPNTKFVLVGEGKTKKRITELISQLGLNSNFLLPGFVNDVRQILSQLSIFVLASNSEGFPVSILEAMSFGIPIVTSKVGGIPELVQDGVTGILVEPNRSEVLASAIIELLANPEKANRMGEMGKLRVKKFFTIEKMMQELESHYLDLAKRKGLQ
jgi:glycosyltransferase involved in cell wall biosynthesis